MPRYFASYASLMWTITVVKDRDVGPKLRWWVRIVDSTAHEMGIDIEGFPTKAEATAFARIMRDQLSTLCRNFQQLRRDQEKQSARKKKLGEKKERTREKR